MYRTGGHYPHRGILLSWYDVLKIGYYSAPWVANYQAGRFGAAVCRQRESSLGVSVQRQWDMYCARMRAKNIWLTYCSIVGYAPVSGSHIQEDHCAGRLATGSNQLWPVV